MEDAGALQFGCEKGVMKCRTADRFFICGAAMSAVRFFHDTFLCPRHLDRHPILESFRDRRRVRRDDCRQHRSRMDHLAWVYAATLTLMEVARC